jgi:hypothetical protein
MTQGDLGAVTVGHWVVAAQTGVGAGVLGVLLTFGRLRSLQTNRWGVAAIAVAGTFLADFVTHPTHFGGVASEAAVTALGAGLLCLLVSYTPVGQVVERLGKIGVDGLDVSETAKRLS